MGQKRALVHIKAKFRCRKGLLCIQKENSIDSDATQRHTRWRKEPDVYKKEFDRKRIQLKIYKGQKRAPMHTNGKFNCKRGRTKPYKGQKRAMMHTISKLIEREANHSHIRSKKEL